MKRDLELKIQAWVDGELTEREAARLGEWITADPEAAAVATSLSQVRKAVAANEPAVSLSVTREFYWGQIERQIRQAERPAPPASVVSGWAWKRWLMPFAGVAAIVCAALITREELRPPTFDETSPSDSSMEAVTFHDQSADVTVVWLQERTQAASRASDAAPAPVSIPDPGESEIEVE